MVRRGYGESNGKIILIGEHAVTLASQQSPFHLLQEK